MNKTAGLATSTLGSLLSEITVGSGSKPKPKPDKYKIEPDINVQFGEDMTPEEIEFVLKGLGLSGPGLVSVREALQKSAAPNVFKAIPKLLARTRPGRAVNRGTSRFFNVNPVAKANYAGAQTKLKTLQDRLTKARELQQNPKVSPGLLKRLNPKAIDLDVMESKLRQHFGNTTRKVSDQAKQHVQNAYSHFIGKNQFNTDAAERIKRLIQSAGDAKGSNRLTKVDKIVEALQKLNVKADPLKANTTALAMAKQKADRVASLLQAKMHNHIENTVVPRGNEYYKALRNRNLRLGGLGLGGLGVAYGGSKLLTKDSELHKEAVLPALVPLMGGLKLLTGFLARKGLTMGARRLLTGFGRKALMGFGRKALTTGARNIGTKAMATGARRLGTQAVSSGAKNMATKGLGQRLAGYGRQALNASMYMPMGGGGQQQQYGQEYPDFLGLGKQSSIDKSAIRRKKLIRRAGDIAAAAMRQRAPGKKSMEAAKKLQQRSRVNKAVAARRAANIQGTEFENIFAQRPRVKAGPDSRQWPASVKITKNDLRDRVVTDKATGYSWLLSADGRRQFRGPFKPEKPQSSKAKQTVSSGNTVTSKPVGKPSKLKQYLPWLGMGALGGMRGVSGEEDPMKSIYRTENIFDTPYGRAVYGFGDEIS
jgi:hypothetical protein